MFFAGSLFFVDSDSVINHVATLKWNKTFESRFCFVCFNFIRSLTRNRIGFFTRFFFCFIIILSSPPLFLPLSFLFSLFIFSNLSSNFLDFNSSKWNGFFLSPLEKFLALKFVFVTFYLSIIFFFFFRNSDITLLPIEIFRPLLRAS